MPNDAPSKVEYPKWIYKRVLNDWGKLAIVDQKLVHTKAEHDEAEAASPGWQEE